MNNQAQSMYQIDLPQCVDLIAAVGSDRTVLAQGHMGSGKSSMLHMLGEKLPKHRKIYFDATTKDLGDIMIPSMQSIEKDGCVRMIPHEELGLHIDGPIILMLDEYGKANPAVKNAMLRLMLERKVGSYSLHPDSIVFATTNLGSEGVGDILPPHARNRMTVVQIKKTNNMDLIEYGINNNWDHSLLGWVKDNPHLMASFEDIKDPSENPYIFDPRAQRAAFVTGRSLEAASDILKVRAGFDDITLTAALMGTIGDRGAMDLMAFVSLSDQLPTLQSIKDNPKSAKVPDSAAAICMVVYRTLSALDKDWLNSWMDYLPRLDTEAQAMFANGVRAPKYSKQSMVMTNKKFTEWAMKNNHLYTADKV
jgi:energy-coupling factor transporter ATP-binding protein EcfA2